ncbi:MAG TPA: hypothetical protein VF902_08420 [Coriobacteriia bacterium]
MRRLAAALVLAVAALSLAACGGGGGSEAAAPATPPPAVVAPVPAAATPGKDIKSPTETVSNEAFPVVAGETPEAIVTRLQAKQPMVVFFYDSTQGTTADQRVEVEAVTKKYRGMIDLLTYDIAAGVAGSDTATDPVVQQAMDMAGTLKVKFTPYILFVDREGRITYRFSGFTDRGLLEREVLRATQ